jgi:hypothetical protein
LFENGKTCIAIANEFGVGKTQIQTIMKRKLEIMEEFEGNVPSNKKRKHTTGYEEINDLMKSWFLKASSRLITITGPILKERALQYAKELGKSEFKASNGWLESLQKK